MQIQDDPTDFSWRLILKTSITTSVFKIIRSQDIETTSLVNMYYGNEKGHSVPIIESVSLHYNLLLNYKLFRANVFASI